MPTGPDDVAADEEGDDRVEAQPAGQHDEQDADDDPDRGPDVGEQVFAVGGEGDRVVLAPGPHEELGPDGRQSV